MRPEPRRLNASSASAPSCEACGTPTRRLDGFVSSVHRCLGCRHVLLGTGTAREHARTHAWGGNGDFDRARLWLTWPRIRRLLPRERRLRVLEIGFGRGTLLRRVLELGHEAHGVDPGLLEIDLDPHVRRNAVLHRGTIEATSLSERAFDFIYGVHVVEHVIDPASMFLKCRHLLKPGGVVYWITPNADSASLPLFRDHWWNLEDPTHRRFFSPASLKRMLLDAGFEEAEVGVPRLDSVTIEGSSLLRRWSGGDPRHGILASRLARGGVLATIPLTLAARWASPSLSPSLECVARVGSGDHAPRPTPQSRNGGTGRRGLNILVLNWQDRRNPLAGGAEVHLHDIFRRIAERGHRITLLCCRFRGAPREEEMDGIRIIRQGSRSLFNFVVPRLYRSLSREDAFDVIVDDINKIPFFTPLYASEPVVGIAHHTFGRSIFLEVGPLAGSYVYGAERLIPRIYRHTPMLVVSPSTRQEFIDSGFRPEQLFMAPNAVDHELLAPDERRRSPSPLIGYFGRLKKYKRVDHVLRAFALVRERIPDCRLWVVGCGDDESRLRRLAHELRIDSTTRFFGFVPEDQKALLLQTVWVVANASSKEGWSITNVEAGACETPVVAADVPGLRDTVQDGRTGLLYPDGSITALSGCVVRLIEDETLRRACGARAAEFARSFSWQASADMVLEVLEASSAYQRAPPDVSVTSAIAGPA